MTTPPGMDWAFADTDARTLDDDETQTIFVDDEPEPPEPVYDEPDPSILDSRKPPSVKARQYERKVKRQFDTLFRLTVSHEKTVPDAAAILMYGPDISTAVGELAAHDERVAKAIDFLTEGAENPYANLAAAVLPLALQLYRNHEPSAEAETTGVRVPFTKRRILTRFKVRIKLGRLRDLSHDPDHFTDYVFTRPGVKAQLDKRGIKVATRKH